VTIREMHMRLTDNPDKVVMTIVFAGLKSGLLEYHSETSEDTDYTDIAAVTDDLVEAGYTYYGLTPP